MDKGLENQLNLDTNSLNLFTENYLNVEYHDLREDLLNKINDLEMYNPIINKVDEAVTIGGRSHYHTYKQFINNETGKTFILEYLDGKVIRKFKEV